MDGIIALFLMTLLWLLLTLRKGMRLSLGTFYFKDSAEGLPMGIIHQYKRWEGGWVAGGWVAGGWEGGWVADGWVAGWLIAVYM